MNKDNKLKMIGARIKELTTEVSIVDVDELAGRLPQISAVNIAALCRWQKNIDRIQEVAGVKHLRYNKSYYLSSAVYGRSSYQGACMSWD